MAFIGNTNTTQAFTPAVDFFSGDGLTTAFTLSRPVASVAQVQVTIDNVAQNPSSAYTVSANTITFTSAPLSGTNNIYVYYTSPITQVIAPGQGTVNTAALTSGLTLTTPTLVTPNITTGLLLTGAAGTAGQYLQSNGSGVAPTWTTLPYAVQYLVIAGGGGTGGRRHSAGGGAGGYRSSVTGESSGGGTSAESPLTLTPGTSYTVTVGAGGTSSTSASNTNSGASNGGDSVFGSITSTGGGYGSTYDTSGASGGSGGGSGSTGTTGTYIAGSGTADKVLLVELARRAQVGVAVAVAEVLAQ